MYKLGRTQIMYRKVVMPKLCTGFEVAHEIQILKEIKMGGTSTYVVYNF